MTGDDTHRGRSGAAFRDWHRKVRRTLPRCGALARSTGEPCRQIGMENGRCYVHGGRTPKGDDWHKPRWPDGNAASFEEKLNRKLVDRERAAKRRAARLAAMTADERARHEEWQRTHKASSAPKRAKARANRQAAAAIRAALLDADQPRPVDQVAKELQRKIDALERRLRDVAGADPADELPTGRDIFS